MKWLFAALLLSASLASSAFVSDGAPELSRNARSSLERLSEESGGSVLVRWNERLRTPAELSGRLTRPSAHTPEWIAFTFLEDAKALYGLSKTRRNLQAESVRRLPGGGFEVRFRRLLYGRPVRGDWLAVRIEPDGVVSRATGTIHPDLERTTFYRRIHPALSETEATEVASAFVEASGASARGPTVLLYYDPTRAGIPLVYAVAFERRASGDPPVVLVHALTGRVLE